MKIIEIELNGSLCEARALAKQLCPSVVETKGDGEDTDEYWTAFHAPNKCMGESLVDFHKVGCQITINLRHIPHDKTRTLFNLLSLQNT